MWQKRRIEPYVTPVRENIVGSKEMQCSEFREESPVDQFLFQDVSVDGDTSIRLSSDIYMLFNQQRLDKLSQTSLLEYFNNISVTEPRFNELRSKLGDEQLISFVKSRFIQSKSELMAWSNYLMSSTDEQIAALASAQSQQTQQSVQPVEPVSME